jgi:hypothetical protein
MAERHRQDAVDGIEYSILYKVALFKVTSETFITSNF